MITGSCHTPLNGRYQEIGHLNEAPIYKNVFNWKIFRYLLHEIPSLGIFANNTYNLNFSSEVTEKMSQRAGK